MGTNASTDDRDATGQSPAEELTTDGSQPAEPLVRQAIREAGADLGDHRVDRRRLLLTGTATGVAATAVTLGAVSTRSQEATPSADSTPSGAMAGHDMSEMEPGAETNQGFTYFVPFQAAVIQAAAARLIPTDDNGPGATEAGVVFFIDRQLAKENMGFRGKEYQLGPFQAGEATQGEQTALPVGDRFRLGIFGLEAYAQQTFSKGFVDCTAEEQDKLLSDLQQGMPENFGGNSIQAAPLTTAPQEGVQISPDVQAGVTVGATAFFNLLLNWTIAGFFCDPVQGGNRDMVGWKLIGFPGAHISYADDIEKYNTPFEGDFISLGQYQEQVGGGV
jgi:gluconate 2-dehydrogenase gamma chain